MEYLPVQGLSDRWNISKRRIQILCKDGRINGAKMIGNMWVVPSNVARPSDARIKNPVVNCSDNISVVRKELKKLLKKLFEIAGENYIDDEDKRNMVLTSIACSLCELFLEDDRNTTELFCCIYENISGIKGRVNIDYNMHKITSGFVEKYRHDSDIANILSWSYQYSNKLIKSNIYSQTQFFTEKYMIDFLVNNICIFNTAQKIVDPCTGGGNFLVECLEQICKTASKSELRKDVIYNAGKLYGYDIDKDIARIAIVNIKLRAMAILSRYNVDFDFNIWNEIKPNIYVSLEDDTICGSLATDNRTVKNLVDGTLLGLSEALGNADIILTNPPFATIKGMIQDEKDFLKQFYPDSNCDTCVSFLEAIYGMLKENGKCGIVSQNAWMHLKSFKNIRNRFTSQYTIHKIANLGSGAFQDLSGEKSNVSLIVLEKNKPHNNHIDVLNITNLTLREKKETLISGTGYVKISQADIDGPNGYDFTGKSMLNTLANGDRLYKDIAIPMQGTSTGNAKELVGYYWKHFGDNDWVIVSNGGGYSRWQGLNDSVVKWGKEGEYIKAQKGSALRNAKYFDQTQLVFSDTGTAGLNVRILLDKQIFIASGPGIRIQKGNKYAHLALLNSRLASYYVKTMSPKLTIAAGYIGQIPIKDDICSSVVLSNDAKLCIDLKKKILSYRPNNLEFDSMFLNNIQCNLDNAAWQLFNEDITNELFKLEIENRIDQFILKVYGLSDEETKQISQNVGICAYIIDGDSNVDLEKLDKYISNLLDASCCLKRTRVSKNSLGCDGILEYVSKDLNINPDIIVHKVQENPFMMCKVLNKYKDMILHNAILCNMGYNTQTGVTVTSSTNEELSEFLNTKFGKSLEYGNWINETFNKVHSEIFKGVPYMVCENGVVHIND